MHTPTLKASTTDAPETLQIPVDAGATVTTFPPMPAELVDAAVKVVLIEYGTVRGKPENATVSDPLFTTPKICVAEAAATELLPA